VWVTNVQGRKELGRVEWHIGQRRSDEWELAFWRDVCRIGLSLLPPDFSSIARLNRIPSLWGMNPSSSHNIKLFLFHVGFWSRPRIVSFLLTETAVRRLYILRVLDDAANIENEMWISSSDDIFMVFWGRTMRGLKGGYFRIISLVRHWGLLTSGTYRPPVIITLRNEVGYCPTQIEFVKFPFADLRELVSILFWWSWNILKLNVLLPPYPPFFDQTRMDCGGLRS